MSNLWDELSDAVLGTSAQIATASLNVIEGTNTHAPVKSGEASHRDTVISSLKTASQDENITDAKLKQKFSSLADKISRPLADDFGPLEVAKMIIELLQNYDEELSFLRHTKGRAKTMGPRRMGSIVMHQSLTMNNLRRDSEDGDSDEDGDKGEDAKLLDKEILKSEEEEQPDHITLKEMLRLELHRLVSINIAQNSGGGDAKKFSNLMKFMEDEIARLEGANRALSRTMEKQVRPAMSGASKERQARGLRAEQEERMFDIALAVASLQPSAQPSLIASLLVHSHLHNKLTPPPHRLLIL